MKYFAPILIVCILSPFAHATDAVSKIAFGSCLDQNYHQFIWDSISSLNPNMFVFMGDNIYADTTNPNELIQKYQILGTQPKFNHFKKHTPIYATWDDHDYGLNNAGSELPSKQQSESIFLDFFEIPKDADSRKREGIYSAHTFGSENKKVQLILLDTRYFRGKTKRNTKKTKCKKYNYGYQLSPLESMLGSEQWEWLDKQLKQPATFRIIVSSIQVIPIEYCGEKWSNFPLERNKLFDLIAKNNAEGVIFLSGDRHLAEVSMMIHESIDYPLYEFTSSGLNTVMQRRNKKNKYRISPNNYRVNNFGLISFDWEKPSPTLTVELLNAFGEKLYEYTLDSKHLSSNKKIANTPSAYSNKPH